VAAVLMEIQQSSEKVNEMVNQITLATHEQNQGIAHVNQAVQQMDKVMQGNAAGSEESAAAAEELWSQSEQLSALVDDLWELVRGAKDRIRQVPRGSAHADDYRRPFADAPKWPIARASNTVRRSKAYVAQDDQNDFSEFNNAA
jgi:methyl-accepting chemotaxis protein